MPQNASTSPERMELIQKFDWEIRQLNTVITLAVTAVAQQIGMNASDMQCAEFLVRQGPMTAGQLAELSGLTTGAITGVVDRLERAGWARRENDPADRRRVIIRAVPQDTNAEEGLYDPYTEAMSNLLADYDDQELHFILEFISRLSATNAEIASQIRSGSGAKR